MQRESKKSTKGVAVGVRLELKGVCEGSRNGGEKGGGEREGAMYNDEYYNI